MSCKIEGCRYGRPGGTCMLFSLVHHESTADTPTKLSKESKQLLANRIKYFAGIGTGKPRCAKYQELEEALNKY
jgi:hypothetical protein